MLNKILLPLLILIMLPLAVNAQEVKPTNENEGEKIYYLHKGKLFPKDQLENYTKPRYKDNLNRNIFGDVVLSPDDLADTLGYRQFFSAPPNSNFGFFGQDRMVMWFEAPAEMRIVSAGVLCYENNDTTAIALKLINFAWTMDQIRNQVPFPTYLGYYEAAGNGYNDATAYLDDPDITGGWVDSTYQGLTSPFGNDLWSDGGEGYPFTPIPDNTTLENYNWVDMNLLGEPVVNRFDIIGVSVKNLDPEMVTAGQPNPPNRVGFYADNELYGQPIGANGTFKFYQGGRITPPTDYGWWAREFYWDFVLAVVLTGDVPPDINSFTQLTGTISNAPRTVDANITDENPSGGPMGVDTAKIVYSTDGWLTSSEVIMTGTEPNFTGDIPGMPGGTEVAYRIDAIDLGGNVSSSFPVVYYVSEVVNGTNLVILNGFDDPAGFPQDYYFGGDVQTGTTTFPYDVWSYGPVESILLDNYTNVFEIWNADQGDYNEANIRTWLEADGSRNYFLAGQEYLGAKSGYVDSAYVAGDFEYDILGIMQSYNDITYWYRDCANETNTIGDSIGTRVFPLAGTLFGDPIISLFNSLSPPADSIVHNPLTILDPGDGSELNWQDAFDVVNGAGVVVDMNVKTKGIGDGPARCIPDVQLLPTLIHRELTAGNKIVFGAFDPLSINTNDDSTAANFHWMGFDNASPTYQALLWFGVALGVEKEDNLIPEAYSLSQNYPNPFNPSTSIKFSIPEASDVVLKVYDILGSEVAVLVNDKIEAGNYTVDFDASKFASGMYIYSIKAGEFSSSKKMMLLK